MEYGLIGGRLEHSFSQPIHEQLCPGIDYRLCPLPEERQAREFLEAGEFSGINVTIPYKQVAMEYCSHLDAAAQAIGAVNTVVRRGGELYGYNTDYAGFLYMARRAGVEFRGKNVLILGTGATSLTVHAAVTHEGAAHVHHASRSGAHGALTYRQAAQQGGGVDVIVNTTPAGMYPDVDRSAVELQDYPSLCAVLDVVYNPMRTELLQQAAQRGVAHSDGLPMLVAQAFYAQEHFQGRKLDETLLERVLRAIRADRANLVLVGMPSSGKSSVGRACARLLGKQFVDVDREIERQAGRPIRDILQPGNEEPFRELESQVTARIARECGQVIATGGGAVLRPENVRRLRRNGVVLFLDRPLELLKAGGGRPLSQTRQALEEQYRARLPLYQAACHARVENSGVFDRAAEKAREAFYEVLDSEWA